MPYYLSRSYVCCSTSEILGLTSHFNPQEELIYFFYPVIIWRDCYGEEWAVRYGRSY